MATITLRVLDGTDRGKVFESVDVPVTIGREEGNTIQLNDERVSRFHLRIQRDHDDLVLTDLGSTNGSKVNNEDVQLKILRLGDVITLGRSSMLLGTRDEINDKGVDSRNATGHKRSAQASSEPVSGLAVADDKSWHKDSKLLLNFDPPKLPERLSPGQAAQLTELLEFLHSHVRQVVEDAVVDRHNKKTFLPPDKWQRLLDANAYLAEYMRRVSNPD